MTEYHYASAYTLPEAERIFMRYEIAKEILRWTQGSQHLSKKEQARARALAEDIRQGASAEDIRREQPEKIPKTRGTLPGTRKSKARAATKSPKGA